MKDTNKYIIVDNDGRRMCKDKKFRDIACFGSYPECVKIYKQRKSAENIQNAFNQFNHNVKIVVMMGNQTMDASGNIFPENN